MNEIIKKAGVKFGEKGIINLGKLVPEVGAVINGGLDYAETKVIGKRAYKAFFEGNFDCDEKDKDEEIIDIDEVDIKEAEI